MQNQRIYSFDGFELDAANRQLRQGDKPLSLPAKAFDVLVALVESNGRLVSKDEIFAHVWGDQIVEESNLSVHISQIRKALGETKSNSRFIETVSGYGYRFTGDVSNSEKDEFVIVTETLSRITIDKEVGNAEERGLGDTEVFEAHQASSALNLGASPRPRFTALQKIAAAAFVVVLFAGGFFLLKNLNQGIFGPAALADTGAKFKRLTIKGNITNAVLSPDGKFFAYTSREKDVRRDSLWLGQTSGNADVQLRPSADLAYIPRTFSVDGNWLYYTESEPRKFTGTLYKIQALGGVPEKILDGVSTYTVLSKDEKRIAYIRDQQDKTSVLVVSNLDGTEQREIAVRQGEKSFSLLSLAWSPEGAFIAFSAGTGRLDEQEIFLVNTVSEEVRQLTALGLVSVHSLKWKTDGSELVGIVSDRNSLAATQIWRIDSDSGKAERITNDLQTYGTSISLSVDSAAMLAVQSTKESNIWVAPVEDLVAARQITFASSGLDGWYGADWTPDGKIIYSSRVDQSLTLWSMDADGSNAKQITPVGFRDHRPTVTPDGKYIIFQSNRSGPTEIWRANLDGSDLMQLTNDGSQNFIPHVTPDSSAVFYTHYANDIKSIRRVPVRGGESTQITGPGFSEVRVSPDGNFFACGRMENGKPKLLIIPINGGEPFKSFDVPPSYNFSDSIRWTRDGNFISYRDWANGIWQQDISGGEPKRIEGLPEEKLYAFEWSPDGKQFAFTRGREVRDVVLISDFR